MRRETAGRAPPLRNQGIRENGQALVETHAQIDKHTYGVSHTQRREKKVSVAVPPPLQTFLEHLHSLNILAEVEKKRSSAQRLSCLFTGGNKFGFNKSLCQEVEVIATFF